MNADLLPLLPSLVALVDQGGVGRAAKQMRVSQPRMSARLASLRRLLDDPLLVQAGKSRGLVPTERARHLADAARRLLNDLDSAVTSGRFDPMAAERTFAVMANDNAAAIVGLPVSARIRANSGSRVRMSLHQFDGERLGDLENGRIDLALGAPIQFEKMPFLITRTIVRDRFISAVGPGGQVARDLDDFCGRDHVLVSGEGGGFDGLVDHALAALGRRRRVALSVQSYLLAIEAVAASDMIVTLPGALLTKGWRNLILFEPVLPLPSFTLSAAWHPRMDSASAHRWLRDQLAHVCRC